MMTAATKEKLWRLYEDAVKVFREEGAGPAYEKAWARYRALIIKCYGDPGLCDLRR